MTTEVNETRYGDLCLTRTGNGSARIVSIAGVLEKIYARIRSMGVDPRQVSSYFSAPKNAIVACIDHVRQTYGSAAGYLRKKAGIEQKVIDQLKKDL
jgi:hypothetical protein